MTQNQYEMEKPEAKEYKRESIYLYDPQLTQSDTKVMPEKCQIFPDISYWLKSVKNKSLDHLFDPDGRLTSVPIYELESSIYVSKDRYEKVARVLDELSIEKVHIDNLLVPLLRYDDAGNDYILMDIEDAVKDMQNLKLFFAYLENGLRPVSLKFKFPHEWIFNHRTNAHEPSKTIDLKVKDQRIIPVLSQILVRVYKTDPELKNFIEESDYNAYNEFNRKAYEKDQRLQCVLKAAEYLKHVGLYSSHSNASIILGGLFSTVGDVVDRDTFLREDQNESYSKVEDLWRDRYRRQLKVHFDLGENRP